MAAKMLPLLLPLLLLLPRCSFGMISEGEIFAGDDGPWVVGYFCYDFTTVDDMSSSRNAMSLVLDNFSPESNQTQTVVFYNQTQNSWDKAEKADTCLGAVDDSYYSLDFSGGDEQSAFDLSSQTVAYGSLSKASPPGYVEVYVAMTTKKCASRDLAAAWSISFNQPTGGFFRQQFSCQDFGVFECYLFALPAFLIIGFLHMRQYRELKRMESVHSIMRIFSAAVAFQCGAVVLNVFHLLSVANNGAGILLFKWFSEGGDVIGQLSFIFVLLALARGWTVTSVILEGKGLMMCLFGTIAMLYLCFFVWQSSFMYLNIYTSTLGLFDTYPGILLVFIRIAIAVVFSYFCYRSHAECNHSMKRAFIRKFGIFFAAWMGGFLACLALAQAAPFYSVKKWNTLVYLSFGCGGLAAFMHMTWPSRISDYFDMTSSEVTTGEATVNDIGATSTAGGRAQAVQRAMENSTVSSSTTPYDRL